MPTTNFRVALVVDGNNLKFEPNNLKLGKLGAEPVRQPLVDMIATRYFIDRRFVHVRIVVDVNALVEEGRFWGKKGFDKAKIDGFFEELETHPTIRICKGSVEDGKSLIEGIGAYYASNPTFGRVILGLGKGGHDPALIENISKACHGFCVVDTIQPWSSRNFLVDPLERQKTAHNIGDGSLELAEVAARYLSCGVGLRRIISVQFDGPVPTVPGNAGDRIEYYSPAAVEEWTPTFLDPVITVQFPDVDPSKEDFREIRKLCFDYYHKDCSLGENCDKSHKYGKEGEKFLWAVRHLPCVDIENVCGEADYCLFGHHAILGRCNRSRCRFLDWHHPSPRMTGFILENGELQEGAPASPATVLSEFWEGEDSSFEDDWIHGSDEDYE